MENIKVSYTLKYQKEVIKIHSLIDIKHHPLRDILIMNLVQLERKMFSEAASTLIKKDHLQKFKIDFK